MINPPKSYHRSDCITNFCEIIKNISKELINIIHEKMIKFIIQILNHGKSGMCAT